MVEESANFDWVTARSQCSTAVLFEQLKQQVKDDVATRKALLPEMAHYGFRFISTSNRSFSVLVEGNKIHDTVYFECKPQEIGIFCNDELLYNAVPSLDSEGHCKLRINDQQYELWQVRQMALENLFFKSY
jgi:hypothetical protein